MIDLSEENIWGQERKSSKGNQLKWKNGGKWYKADYTGYEGLAEYVVSSLLKSSDLMSSDYIVYQTVEIAYKDQNYRGCSSEDFLPEKWQLITLERLFHSFYGKSFYLSVYEIQGIKERAEFLVEQVIEMTGLQEFGTYLAHLLTIDALFLNEDRHLHNIAVLLDPYGKYHYCPIFDHGASLLSDTKLDYPEHADLRQLLPTVRARTLSDDFDEQLDAVERLYGRTIRFSFEEQKIKEILDHEKFYPEKQKHRVMEILLHQRRKYDYLF